MQQVRNPPHTQDTQRKQIEAHVIHSEAARFSGSARVGCYRGKGKTAGWLTGGLSRLINSGTEFVPLPELPGLRCEQRERDGGRAVVLTLPVVAIGRACIAVQVDCQRTLGAFLEQSARGV